MSIFRKKKVISWLTFLTLMLSFVLSAGLNTEQVYAAETGSWQLVETNKHIPSTDYNLVGEIRNTVMGTTGFIFDKYLMEGEEGKQIIIHSRRVDDGSLVAHVNYEITWDLPPSQILAGAQIGLNFAHKEISSSGGWGTAPGGSIYIDAGNIKPGGGTGNGIDFVNSEGNRFLGRNESNYFQMKKAMPVGTAGTKKALNIVLGNGYGYNYIYEWKEGPVAPTPTPTPSLKNSAADPFDSGARIMWQPASKALGYRLFRSVNKAELGISVTDFYITGTSYADVNVQPNTTYYYTVKPVLAEAKPFEGTDEKLGDVIASLNVTTGGQIYKPGVYKHFILLKLDNPYMSVDGTEQEVDPGHKTAPMLMNGRTMVPIRAIVEAMGGSIGWDGGTRKASIDARGNQIDMWIDKLDLKVNGKGLQMDVAPAIKGARTFLPIRFVGENLNCKVDWINSTKEIVIVYVE